MSDKIIEKIIGKLNKQLKMSYSDFKGLYFYGPEVVDIAKNHLDLVIWEIVYLHLFAS